MGMSYRLGVDVGGTFTDFVLVSSDGSVMEAKTASTPTEPGAAIRNGLAELADRLDVSSGELLKECHLLIHGTTVALNTLLQHRGAKTGLICTEGFRDSLEIRLGYRDARYDFRNPPPPLLVPRHLRRGVGERVDKEGKIVVELDDTDVLDALEYFAREEVEAVAVCLLWSFYNNTHERRIAELVEERMPSVYLSLSSDVAPQIREYDRTSTTVLNAYVGPRLAEYIRETERFLRDLGYDGEIRYVQSNGGLASGHVIEQRAVLALQSGPAAAPAAGLFAARGSGSQNLITIDMGGTSFDACLIDGGRPDVVSSADVRRYRVAVPMININTIGAGGGSIGWLDRGLLRVGPQSAEAVPGPACYMRGGTEPTVTDADVVLGYLNPEALLGGRFKIDSSLAERAIAEKLAEPLGLSVDEAALGVFEIVNRNMAGAISAITLERGYDPRDFTMIAGGGQGPVHAAHLAHELGIPEIVVPRYASTFCAFGALATDLRHDYKKSFTSRVGDVDAAQLEGLFEEMELAGRADLRSEGVSADAVIVHRHLDMRYVGQVYEIPVDVSSVDLTSKNLHAELEELLHLEHEREYTYRLPSGIPEIINAAVTSVGVLPGLELPEVSGDRQRTQPIGTRSVLFGGETGRVAVPIFDGESITAGREIPGPAIVEERHTTVVVPPEFSVELTSESSYVLRQES